MSAPATFSTEGKVISYLAALKMTRKELCGICKSLSIPISESLMSICLSGRREFTQWTGIALLAVLKECSELRDSHGVALQWSSEDIATALVQRRMACATELAAL